MEQADLTTRILHNPYPHVIPDADFNQLIGDLAQLCGTELKTRYSTGEFKRDSLGLCLMDPTRPREPGSEAVMALIILGVGGRDYLENAVAKAVEHQDLGQDCGIAAYVQPYKLRDGSFVYGHSAEVGGTIVGASGLSEAQDRLMASIFAARFNYRVTAAHQAWKEQFPDHKWFCNRNQSHIDYARIANQIAGGTLEYTP